MYDYNRDYQMYMRDAEIDARRRWDEMQMSRQQQLQPQMQQPVQQTYNNIPQQNVQQIQTTQDNTNNVIMIKVNNMKEAKEYPVDKNGNDMYFLDESNKQLYQKYIDIGTGSWSFKCIIGDMQESENDEMSIKAEPKMDLDINFVVEQMVSFKQDILNGVKDILEEKQIAKPVIEVVEGEIVEKPKATRAKTTKQVKEVVDNG